MRRQCARPGCSAVAITTFTFDSREQIVFLDVPREGAARAGELCARHARALSAPRGWQVVDRQDPATLTTAGAPTPAATQPPLPVSSAPPAHAAVWHPRFERGDTLGGLLDAS